VRSHDARRQDPASLEQARHHPRRRRRLVRLSSRNISSTRTAVRSASRQPAIRRRRARITPASATRMSATSPARWSRASRPLPRRRHQPRRHQRRGGKGQWEFQIFGKGSRRPPTKCGWPAI
jgi:hypothetical protein